MPGKDVKLLNSRSVLRRRTEEHVAKPLHRASVGSRETDGDSAPVSSGFQAAENVR